MERWSDGAIIGLKLAIRNPDQLSSGLFAFGANSKPSGLYDLSDSKIFERYLKRSRKEYETLSSAPGEYDDFLRQMSAMWASQPDLAEKDLRSIKVPVWIADGDHEEVIRRKDTLFIDDSIPASGLLLQPEVSHFSFLQDPHQFTEDVLCFLQASGVGKKVSSNARFVVGRPSEGLPKSEGCLKSFTETDCYVAEGAPVVPPQAREPILAVGVNHPRRYRAGRTGPPAQP